MYVLFCMFLLIWGWVFYLLAVKSIDYAARHFRSLYNPDSLTHDEIIALLTRFSHPEFEGVCYGFSLNWALAVAEDKEDVFYRQLHLLRAHKSDLPDVLEHINQKKDRLIPLSESELQTLSLPQLCDKLCIAQDPLAYKNHYGKLVWQSDVTAILKRIQHRHSGVQQIFYKTHTFGSRQEALGYFTLLAKSGLAENVAVIISTADHAMGFKRAGNLWRFININDLYIQDTNKPYFEFDSHGLVDELYRVSTSGPLIRRLTVNTDFIAVNLSADIISKLGNRYPVFPVPRKTPYPERLYFFSMAALQGDLSTVKQCLRARWPVFSRQNLSDDSPILKAVYLGRREVVRAMLSGIPHLVNNQRKKDLATLLHIACKYGGAGIVGDLLCIKGIKINPLDIQGKTPLMYACKLTVTTQDRTLFQLLLNGGASLNIKDKNGLTALDHAVKNKHELAIELFHNKMQRDEARKQSAHKRQRLGAQSGLIFFNKTPEDEVSEVYMAQKGGSSMCL